MNKIFVDTWAWYALVDVKDADHTLAQETNEQLLRDGYIFITTNFVLDEAITLIQYNLHHQAAVRFYAMLQQLINDGSVEMIRIEENHELAAWDLLKQYDDQVFSYTDCTSFVVMQALKLTQAFTVDHHFSIMRLTLIP